MKHIILLLSLLTLCFVGCSSNIRVSGKVTFEDGSPVNHGTVMFTSEASTFRGTITNGSYDVAMKTAGKGVKPGKYKVWLSDTERLEREYGRNGQPQATGTIAFPQVTGDFVNPKSTPLDLEVKWTWKSKVGFASITYDVVVKQHPDWDKQQEYKPK